MMKLHDLTYKGTQSVLLTTLITLCTIIVPGCKDDDLSSPVYNNDWADSNYFILASQEQSRVSYKDEHTSVFEDGDIVGAFAFNESEGVIDANVPMNVVTRTNEETGQSVQVLVPQTNINLTKGANRYLFYYPYQASMTIEKAQNLSHSVAIDQSASKDTDNNNYEKSDFIWDYVQPGPKSVRITFEHLMANIVVIVPNKDASVYTSITVYNQPLSISDANLLTENLEDVNYTVEDSPVGNLTQSDKIRSSRPAPDMHDGSPYFFRIAVPACRKLNATDDNFLTVNMRGGATKNFRLKNDIMLKPGHNYYFTISNFTPPVIDVDDDASWVLEVYTPGNKLVGYLCREYLYYVPADYMSSAGAYRDAPVNDIVALSNYEFKKSDGNLNVDGVRDYMVRTNPGNAHGDALLKQINVGEHPIASSGTIAINSQAWVFYNLIPGTKTPNLGSGKVLRFLYDIVGGGNLPGYTPVRHPKHYWFAPFNQRQVTTAVWPYPNIIDLNDGVTYQGAFKVKHGHERLNTSRDGSGITNAAYAYDSAENLEYYMHGGTITWDGAKNIIDCFEMPEDTISNSIAYAMGHIAWKDGIADVSYSDIISSETDIDGAEVCYTVEKYIQIGDVSYPLRKVGYNMFWTGRSLSSTVDRDGNPLTNFNVKTSDLSLEELEENKEKLVGLVNYQYSTQQSEELKRWQKYGADQVLPSGFIYPTARKGEYPSTEGDSESYQEDFDPVNNPELNVRLALLYNNVAFTSGKLKPADNSEATFRFPSWRDMTLLRRYGGYLFAAKWITDELRTHMASGSYLESTNYALSRGMLLKSDSYCANISGLDFRPFGTTHLLNKDDKTRPQGFGIYNAFFIDISDKSNDIASNNEYRLPEVFKFAPWDCWGSNPLSSYRNFSSMIGQAEISRFFAPIRVIMSFKNNDNISIGQSRSLRRPKVTSATSNIRLELEEM